MLKAPPTLPAMMRYHTLEAVAYHEAGHAVAALFCREEYADVEVYMSEEGEFGGRLWLDWWAGKGGPLKGDPAALCVICAAGQVAGDIFLHRRNSLQHTLYWARLFLVQHFSHIEGGLLKNHKHKRPRWYFRAPFSDFRHMVKVGFFSERIFTETHTALLANWHHVENLARKLIATPFDDGWKKRLIESKPAQEIDLPSELWTDDTFVYSHADILRFAKSSGLPIRKT